jgi:hypothetical protein
LNTNRCNCPLIEREDQYQLVNNWTKILGSHAIKVGADLRYARNLRVPSDNNRTGILYFGTGPTSNLTSSRADLVLQALFWGMLLTSTLRQHFIQRKGVSEARLLTFRTHGEPRRSFHAQSRTAL